jgi:hypothetical protein
LSGQGGHADVRCRRRRRVCCCGQAPVHWRGRGRGRRRGSGRRGHQTS